MYCLLLYKALIIIIFYYKMGLADFVKKIESVSLLNASDDKSFVSSEKISSPSVDKQKSVISSITSFIKNTPNPPIQIGKYRNSIYNKLKYIYDIKNLQCFYSENQLQYIADLVSQNDLDLLTKKLSFQSVELTIELTALALFDIVILADDSGSMLFDRERVDDLTFIISSISEIITLFDKDGISIRTFNGSLSVDNLTDEKNVKSAISKMNFSGGTPIASSLSNKILNPMIIKLINKNALQKPVLVLIITDGQPDSKNDVVNVISSLKSTLEKSKYGSSAVSFQFAQVGRDRQAQEWLSEIDSDNVIGNMIDATSYFEYEQEEYMKKGLHLTPYLWLLKLLMGSIDPKYDEEDEI